MSSKITALALGCCLTLGGLTISLSPTAAYAQQKDAKALNIKVGTPLKAALDALKNKQYDTALAKVKEAEAEKKTAYEQFKINETLAAIYYGQKKYAELAGVYEKMLETPQFLGEQSPVNAKAVAQMYAAAQQRSLDNKVIEYSKRWLQDKPNDGDVLALLGQTYYSVKEYKACKDTMLTAISNIEKNGGKPAANALDMARSCSDSMGDATTAAQILEKLCRYYPEPKYWQPYIRSQSRGASDLASFHWSRLMNDVGVLKDHDDFSNYAQQAMLQYGSPSEGLRVVDEGFKKNILGADAKLKVRDQKLMDNAKAAAQAEKSGRAQLEAEADKDPTGEKNVAVGMSYFGDNQYDQAISELEKGLKKGGLKEPGNAKLTLGVAQLKKHQVDAARATFKSLTNDPQLGKVAAAWILRSYN